LLGYELWQLLVGVIVLTFAGFLVFQRRLAILMLVLIGGVITWPLPTLDFISYSHALTLVAIIAWVAWRLHNHLIARRHVKQLAPGNEIFSPTLLYAATALLAAAAVLSVLWNVDRIGRSYFSGFPAPFLLGLYLYVAPPALALAISDAIKIRAHARQLIYASIVPFLLVFGLQMYYFLTRSGFPGSWGEKTTNAISFLSAGNLSLFMMVVFLVFLGILMTSRRRGGTLLALIVVFLAGLSILVSLGRGVWVGCAVGIITMILIGGQTRFSASSVLRRICMVWIVAIILLMWLPIPLQTSYDYVAGERARASRVEMTRLQVAAWLHYSPVFGVGLGQGTGYASILLPVSSMHGLIAQGYSPSHAAAVDTPGPIIPVSGHNQYAKVLLEMGGIGFVALVTAGVASMRYSWLLYTRARQDFSRAVGLGMMGATSALMVVGITQSAMLHLSPGTFSATIYFWVFLGVVLALLKIETSRRVTGSEIATSTR